MCECTSVLVRYYNAGSGSRNDSKAHVFQAQSGGTDRVGLRLLSRIPGLPNIAPLASAL